MPRALFRREAWLISAASRPRVAAWRFSPARRSSHLRPVESRLGESTRPTAPARRLSAPARRRRRMGIVSPSAVDSDGSQSGSGTSSRRAPPRKADARGPLEPGPGLGAGHLRRAGHGQRRPVRGRPGGRGHDPELALEPIRGDDTVVVRHCDSSLVDQRVLREDGADRGDSPGSPAATVSTSPSPAIRGGAQEASGLPVSWKSPSGRSAGPDAPWPVERRCSCS